MNCFNFMIIHKKNYQTILRAFPAKGVNACMISPPCGILCYHLLLLLCYRNSGSLFYQSMYNLSICCCWLITCTHNNLDWSISTVRKRKMRYISLDVFKSKKSERFLLVLQRLYNLVLCCTNTPSLKSSSLLSFCRSLFIYPVP